MEFKMKKIPSLFPKLTHNKEENKKIIDNNNKQWNEWRDSFNVQNRNKTAQTTTTCRKTPAQNEFDAGKEASS